MTLKCKVNDTAITNPSCCHCQASPEYEEQEETTEPKPTPTNTEDRPDLTNSDIEDDDEDLVNPDAIYEKTKVLGNADCEVRIDFLLPWDIFDILQRLCMQRPRMIALKCLYNFQKSWGESSSTNRKEDHWALVPYMQVCFDC